MDEPMLIQVKVGPGIFRSERSVSFEAGDRRYELIVDQANLVDDRLKVWLVAEFGDEALIDLPRETFSSGSRIRVPTSLLQPA
jgi:hypothetical protein